MIISRLCHLTWIEAAIAELRPAQRVGSGVELAVRFLCRFTRSIKMKLAAPFPSAGRRSASRARFPHWCGRAPGSVLPRKLVKLSFALTTLCCSRFAPSLCLFLASRTSCLLLGCCFGGFGWQCHFKHESMRNRSLDTAHMVVHAHANQYCAIVMLPWQPNLKKKTPLK